MWELMQQLGAWILSLHDDFEVAGLTPPEQKNIVVGMVDLSRYDYSLVISILPDDEEDIEEGGEYNFIDGHGIRRDVTITIICRKDKYDELIQKACNYTDLLCEQLRLDSELGGVVSGLEIGQRKYFLDAGAVEQQLTAVEISLTLFSEE